MSEEYSSLIHLVLQHRLFKAGNRAVIQYLLFGKIGIGIILSKLNALGEMHN
jgi:hypothetical protein